MNYLHHHPTHIPYPIRDTILVEINKKEERREHVAVRKKRKKIEVEKNKPLYIMFVIKRDELMEAQDEVRELERLLNEAWLRRRNLLKKKSMQGWWDWVLEFIGY
jgi:hypothetical protein